MKPVAILRFSSDDGPGYFASFLDRHWIPWTLFKLDQGEMPPTDIEQFSGLGFMGGAMSANDSLPWTEPVLALMKKAFANEQPCIGHCLGGQLMSRALGGVVTKNPVKEIGWNPLVADDNEIARQWLGKDIVDDPNFTTFQWHGETFTLPQGATRILSAPACANQAYVFGNSLGMQCHVEMTPDMIEEWCGDWASEHADASLPSVQTPDEMREAMHENLKTLNQLADRLYTKWIAGLPAH
ncbi:MAG: type 1 glutamine amidotransferase [Betaproteobacteria bacterium]